MRQSGILAIGVVTVTTCALYGALVPTSAATVEADDRPAAAVPVPPPSIVAAPRSFTLVATGDLLSHDSVLAQAAADAGGSGYDYERMLAGVRPIIERADLGLCHLETPIAPPGVAPHADLPIFGAPGQIASEIAAIGYDRCSLASNHALDQRVAGIDATLDAFDAAGLGHAGMARREIEAAASRFVVGGVPVAHISASYAFNGFSPPADQPWRVTGIDPARLIADATAARAAGAAVVIVSLHWGLEGHTEVTPEQRTVAEALTASGAVDLIIGHHAHVVQPIEQVNGRWVVFGLGNQLSGMGDATNCCGVRALDGLMVEVRISEQPDGRFVVERPVAVPTYLGRRPYRVVPVIDALADPAVAGHIARSDLEASLARTTEMVGGFLPTPPAP